jgi:hypothetical protein
MEHETVHLRTSSGVTNAVGCGRCPVDLVRDARYARYNVAGGPFPVGLSSLRLLTMYFLSQAGRLGGLHRASPVPFRASYFTPRVHPLDATAQRLTAYWYRQWSFPLIPSPRFVAHFMRGLLIVRIRNRKSLQLWRGISIAKRLAQSEHRSAGSASF